MGDAVEHYQTPDVLYHCDAQWWDNTPQKAFLAPEGRRYYCDEPKNYVRTMLAHKCVEGGHHGLEHDWPRLAMGGNSGHQAVNLAWHMGARRVALVGFNMQKVDGRMHYFGDHPQKIYRDSPYDYFRLMYRQSAPIWEAAGLRVFNCTSRSALTMFPSCSLETFLQEAV